MKFELIWVLSSFAAERSKFEEKKMQEVTNLHCKKFRFRIRISLCNKCQLVILCNIKYYLKLKHNLKLPKLAVESQNCAKITKKC